MPFYGNDFSVYNGSTAFNGFLVVVANLSLRIDVGEKFPRKRFSFLLP
jgi:hypothetical protein